MQLGLSLVVCVKFCKKGSGFTGPRWKGSLFSWFNYLALAEDVCGFCFHRTANRRPDLSIIAPGRGAARMPGTGPLRRSSGPARKRAIVDKSRVEPDRRQRPSFVFLLLVMIGLIATPPFRPPPSGSSAQSCAALEALPCSSNEGSQASLRGSRRPWPAANAGSSLHWERFGSPGCGVLIPG